MSEFIYILENSSMPGLIKIGRTERTIPERVNELSSHTGVPTDFVVAKEYAVPNSAEAERIIHERLLDYRVANNREFFRLDAGDAANIIESILDTAKPEARRDFEREDELVARAISIVVEQGCARPRMLEEMLGISYEEALFVINSLRGRGVIGEGNESKLRAASYSRVVAPPPLPQPVVLQPNTPTTIATRVRSFLALFHKPTISQSHKPITADKLVDDHLRPIPQIIESYQLPQIELLNPPLPNTTKPKVRIRDLLESEEWVQSEAKIPLALGKDINNQPIVADLAEMPHLMMAGEVGSGKSICVNSIIASLLYKFGPDQLRLVMIDPRTAELQQYNTLPHLAIPVGNSLSALLALRWVIDEMERRYKIFAKTNVCNITSFNARPKFESQKELYAEADAMPAEFPADEQDEPAPEGSVEEYIQNVSNIHVPRDTDVIIPDHLSYIVLIVENVEDLRKVAKERGYLEDVEAAFERLIPNIRATGIHLILTTRQATRKAVSENTKAEIPFRIAFRCASRVGSREILGEAGAETLAGRGDMLIRPYGSAELVRAQGALITDQEIQRIVAFVATQNTARNYNVKDKISGEEEVSEEDEELVQKCIEIMRQEKKASTSLFQRRLRLGYTRSARVVDILEQRGYIASGEGAKPREILVDLDALI